MTKEIKNTNNLICLVLTYKNLIISISQADICNIYWNPSRLLQNQHTCYSENLLEWAFLNSSQPAKIPLYCKNIKQPLDLFDRSESLLLSFSPQKILIEFTGYRNIWLLVIEKFHCNIYFAWNTSKSVLWWLSYRGSIPYW